MSGEKANMLADLARQIAQVATLDGEFVLRSGQVSDRYFDKYRFEGLPTLLGPLAKAMSQLLPRDTELVAGLELGGIPLATAISLETGLPAAFVRKEAKAYGTRRVIEGQDISGRRITFIDDVITTGGAVADAFKVANEEKAMVLGVVCAIWRGENEPHIVDVPTLPVESVFTRADLEQAILNRRREIPEFFAEMS